MPGRPMNLCAGVVIALSLSIPAGALAGAAGSLNVSDSLGRTISGVNINTTLKNALAELARLGGTRIVVDWAALAAADVKTDAAVTIRLRAATFEQLLDLALSRAVGAGKPLAWRIEGDHIRVTTQQRALGAPRLAPLPQAMRAAASQPTRAPMPTPFKTIEFVGTPLSEVIEFFREQTGLNFHVNWRSLELAGIDKTAEITLSVSGVPLAKVLDMITDDVSGTRDKFSRVWWTVDGGIIRIATGSALNTSLRTRVFDVSDLLMPVPHFPGNRMSISGNSSSQAGGSPSVVSGFSTNRQAGQSGRQASAARRQQLEMNLIDIIRDTIGQDMWQPNGKGSVRIHDGRLIISQTMLGFTLLRRAGVL